MKSVKIACFSPTGTTLNVVRSIADGVDPDSVELINVTPPQARRKPLKTKEDELLIIGVPVYMGRVPALLNVWINTLEANKTPTVCVVVYGNRVYDDALLELANMVRDRGCIPIAGAAYIGEHSFSNSETPSNGRPNSDDLAHAVDFGRQARAKLNAASSLAEIAEAKLPGNHPYGGLTELWDVDFIAVNKSCSQCGHCATICPTGAIATDSSSTIDIHKCITCCACLKQCPKQARSMKDGPVKEAQGRINTLYVEQKRPETFL